MAWLKGWTIRPADVMVAVAIIAAALALGEWFRPSKYWADELGEPRYEEIIPHRFGDWVEVPTRPRMVLDPVQSETLARIYTETFARTFYNPELRRVIMLSIAYGRDQSTDTQIHTPEQCYPSQGFKVEDRVEDQVRTPFGAIEAVRMKTSLGPARIEPLTFFIRVGDHIARGSLERNLARLKMAMRGYRVDGMLLRVSEISRRDDSFAVQDRFIDDLLAAVGPQGRARILGHDLAERKQ